MKNFKLAFIVACFATGMVVASESASQSETISGASELEFNTCLVEYFSLFPMDSKFDVDANSSETVVRTAEFDAAYAIHLAKAYEYCNEKLNKFEKTA